MAEISLRQLKNAGLSSLYGKLLNSQELKDSELEKLLTLAVVLIQQDNELSRKLGYRIVVAYTIRMKDYRPLYDVAINTGLFPIAATIERLLPGSFGGNATFLREFSSAFLENYKFSGRYQTLEQDTLLAFYQERISESITIVAPTSYGKSELIIELLRRTSSNVCVIVPTKSLLAQTKKRIVDARLERIRKVITHPDMYSPSDEPITAVLTQERLLRLLQRNPKLKFDVVFVDEAHNLLESSERSTLLAAAILLLEKRNSNLAFKLLTPFLEHEGNLKINHSQLLPATFKINEYVKSERIYVADLSNSDSRTLKLYDQFLDDFYPLEGLDATVNLATFIDDRSASKNIIYFNKPAYAERFASEFSHNLPSVVNSDILEATRELASYLHADYTLIDCLRLGVLYHHGSVPDNVRIYIESLFDGIAGVRYIVTTSTLLEGVNLPADRLFLLENKKGRKVLSQQQFRNLIGRVCRFGDVFSNRATDLSKLSPEIYIVKTEYMPPNANLETFIQDAMWVSRETKESVENPLLENTEDTEESRKKTAEAEEFVENFEPGTIPDFSRRTVTTEIGKVCFANSLQEIDILEREEEMQSLLEDIRSTNDSGIEESNALFGMLARLFLPFIKDSGGYDNIGRFQHEATLRYYSMFLDWRVRSASYSEMIGHTVRHWERLIQEQQETIVYVGRKWGDFAKDGHVNLWVDIKKKSEKERINLAIVRIKEEMDFLDNILLRFIEAMSDLDLIEDGFYARIKWGTDNPEKILLIKNGLSLSASSTVIDRYRRFLTFDQSADKVEIDPQIIEAMATNNEGAITRLEVKNIVREL